MKNRIKNIVAIVLVAVTVVSIGATNTVYATNNESNSTSDIVPVAASSAVVSKSEVKATTVKSTTNTFKKYTVYVKVGKTNVRAKASSKSKVVKTYYKGTKLTVIGKSGNWRQVGKRLWIHKDNLSTKDPMGSYKGVRLQYYNTYNITKNKLTCSKGVVRYNGHKETWYSSKEYGQSGTAYKIPGKHLAKDGTYRDCNGYICIAANYLSKDAVVMTSLGPGKVYDRGGMRGQWIDIYTNW